MIAAAMPRVTAHGDLQECAHSDESKRTKLRKVRSEQSQQILSGFIIHTAQPSEQARLIDYSNLIDCRLRLAVLKAEV
jgi:hypothetical protein